MLCIPPSKVPDSKLGDAVAFPVTCEDAGAIVLLVVNAATTGIGDVSGSDLVLILPREAIFAKNRGIDAITLLVERKPWTAFAAVTTPADAVTGMEEAVRGVALLVNGDAMVPVETA